MDFFEQQEQARRTSRRLTALVILSVFGILATLQVCIAAVFAMLDDSGKTSFADAILDPALLLPTAAIGGAIILVGTLVKMSALKAGGGAVAESMGGSEIPPDTGDPDERRLLNVVEEMALASGVRVPRVYVLRREKGLNAFAAGHDPDDAAVAVTAGMLQTLNRAELQAVIGHEFSHILNGDMRLNIRLIGILGGILGLSIAGRVIMEIAMRTMRTSGRRSDKKDNGAAIALAFTLLGLAVWLIGSIGVFFGRILQSAVSRQREFLADASATQFTRDPDSLASALKIIGAVPDGARVAAGHTGEVSHMLFASGLTSLFATHPPLVTRIRRLDPAFSGDFGAMRRALQRRLEHRQQQPQERAEAALTAPDGQPDDETLLRHGLLQAAPAILGWLADDEREALRQPESAICCLYGALLAPPSAIRQQQLEAIAAAHGHDGRQIARATEGWQQRHAKWNVRQRRMVCELAVERLRSLPEPARAEVFTTLDVLCRADHHLDDFEFALGHLVRRRLLPEPAAVRLKPLPPRLLSADAALILSALAHAGHATPDAVTAAWQAGVNDLLDPASGDPLFPGIELVTTGLDDPDALDAAFGRLIRLAPLHKRELLGAGERMIGHDARITDAEANYIAAIADAIHAIGWQPQAA